jgi:hypothetical protein
MATLVAEVSLRKTELYSRQKVFGNTYGVKVAGGLTTVERSLDEPFEQKLAKAIIDGTWTTIKEMMDQVYGRKSDVDMSMKMDDGVPIIRGFVIPTAPEDFIDDSGRQNPKYGSPDRRQLIYNKKS